jgi:heme O synthase-like polyprenyltransferase
MSRHVLAQIQRTPDCGYNQSEMASNDPTETGGLFIGRRPGTAPLRYRARPTRAGPVRRRTDAVFAAALLAAETLLLATLWGPQPAGWLWIGSRIFYNTGSIGLAVVVAFVGMLLTILATIGLAMRLDRAWMLVRRASGHEQEKGALERIFVTSMVLAGTAFVIWFLLVQGPGPDIAPSRDGVPGARQ